MNTLPKNFLVVLLFLFSFSSTLEGQTIHEIDSLKTVLKTAKDTTYINTLLRICRVFTQYRLHDSIDTYMNEAYEKAVEGGYKKQELASLDMKAMLLANRKDFAQSIEIHKKILAEWEQMGDDQAMSISYNNLGKTYFNIQAYEKAQEYFFKSLKIAEALDDKPGQNYSYQNIAMILSILDQHEEAIAYRKKVIKYGQKAKDPFTEAIARHGIGVSFRSLEQYDSAFHYLNTCLELATKMKHAALQASALQLMAHTSNKMGQFEQASQFLDQANEFIRPQDAYSLSYQYNYKAASLFGLKRYQEAMQAAQSSLKYAEEDASKTLLNNAYLQLYEFHKELGDITESLSFHELYKEMQDSILEKDKVERIQNLGIQYESEKKEAQILSLQQEAQIQDLKLRQRGLLIAFLLIATFLGIGMLYFFSRQRLLREEFKRLQTEQRLLRTQMNPHFFFHALSSIQEYLLNEKDRKKSVSYLSKFSRLMRNVLDSSRTESISLEEEIQTLENYLALQQLRYDQSFQYEINVDEALQDENFNVPPLLLQPIVENAIEHGLVPKGTSGHLQLDFIKNDDNLQITIMDDGVGRSDIKPERNRESVALSVVQDRLSLLAKNTTKKAHMEVIDLKDEQGQPSGTKVIFYLPLEVAI